MKITVELVRREKHNVAAKCLTPSTVPNPKGGEGPLNREPRKLSVSSFFSWTSFSSMDVFLVNGALLTILENKGINCSLFDNVKSHASNVRPP